MKVALIVRRLFRPLDDALIEHVFQPASNFISYRVGLGRVTVACWCIDSACLFSIVSKARDISGAFMTLDASSCELNTGILLLVLTALVSLRTLFRRMALRRANPLRATMQPYRAIVLLMLVAGLAQPGTPDAARAADVVMLASAAAALYLGACSEPPPIGRPGSVQSFRSAG